MYELVNTSLPNGLIPGSHGFSTVAMTSGMSNLLRSRLESFCAYIHRTSAHDASYFTENPVNWFHATLPSGDHVLGRVAPEDFDYTGRTNRLARLLVFGEKAMPLVGGAYALALARDEMKARWIGEPCYLQENKRLNGQLCMAELPARDRASSWEALFGVRGTDLARRFALLLEKTIEGGGRPIYFKTSTSWDVSGEKLLGLYSDLITFLPFKLRQSATFSTYFACMPNGTTCHLRGIFDSDKVFASVSSSTPWVDCERGQIVNESLLPEVVHIAPTIPSKEKQYSGGTNGIGVRYQGGSSSAAINRASSYAKLRADVTAREKKDYSLAIMIAVTCFCLLILGGAMFWFVVSQNRAKSPQDLTAMRQEEMQAEQNTQTEGNEIKDLDEPYTNKESEKIERFGRTGLLEEVNNGQIKKSEKMVEKIEKSEKVENVATNEVVNNTQKKETVETPERGPQLSDLKIDEIVVGKGEMNKWMKDKLSDSEKASLTNEQSILVFYADKGKIGMCKTALKMEMKKPSLVAKEKIPFYELQPISELEGSKWAVWRFGEKGKVVWQWQSSSGHEGVFFRESDSFAVQESCFGKGTADAVKIYKMKCDLIFAFCWKSGDTLWEVFSNQDVVNIDNFKPDRKDVDDELEKVKNERGKLDNKLMQVNNKIKEMKEDCAKIRGYCEQVAAKEKEKNMADKRKKSKEYKNEIGRQIFLIKKNAASLFLKYGLDMETGSTVPPEEQRAKITGRNGEADSLIKKIENRLEDCKKEKAELESKISKTQEKEKKVKDQFNEWKPMLRNHNINVHVVSREEHEGIEKCGIEMHRRYEKRGEQ